MYLNRKKLFKVKNNDKFVPLKFCKQSCDLQGRSRFCPNKIYYFTIIHFFIKKNNLAYVQASKLDGLINIKVENNPN